RRPPRVSQNPCASHGYYMRFAQTSRHTGECRCVLGQTAGGTIVCWLSFSDVNTALLVMDVQRSVVDRFPDPEYLPRLRKAIDGAHAAGLTVIYVVVRLRPGAPEVSRRNRIFGHLAGNSWPGGDEAMQIHPDVTPEADDVVVTKKRVSAFAGS